MFGLPYIIAPMEAEAQCAYMELENLVDGVVTDDSDVLLFGARSVYKNIFDDRKYVETYFMKDIENELGLNREKLVRMALLLGSDYTEGVSGIGIVNAIEVVNAFPEEDGLQKFREWIESPDPSILGKFGSSSRKRGSKVNGNSKSNIDGASASDQNVSQVDENEQLVDDIKQIFMDKHRNVSKNWHIPSTFPSDAVISAYISPQVDKSTEPFSWGKPDLFVLRKLCWERFGWANKKADELLQPVLKEYNKHETQLRMEAFYTFNERFAKVRSKRINKAVKGITANQSSELVDDTVGEKSKSRKKRKVSPKEPESEELINGKENGVTENENHSPPKQQPKKRKTRGKTVPSEVENSEPSNVRGRGRGRGRGIPISLATESSLSDGIGSSGNEQEVSAEKLKESYEVRRSNRSRKAVNYSVDDFETNEAGNSLNKDEEIAVEEEPSQSPGILGEVYEHKSGDPDYLEAGGGFCMEEDDELVQVSARKNEDPDSRFEFSKEYHKMGGGFCMEEEDETNKGPVEIAGPSHCSVSMDEIHPVGSDYSPKRASPSNEVLNTKDESAPTTARPFSAMPLLRRKRRKS